MSRSRAGFVAAGVAVAAIALALTATSTRDSTGPAAHDAESGRSTLFPVSTSDLFDAPAIRPSSAASAAIDPADWAEGDVSRAIRAYARLRGRSPAGSGVPAAQVTDVPRSGQTFLEDALTADGGLVVQVVEATRLLGWEQVALQSSRELTVRAVAPGRLGVVHDRPVGGGDLWDLRGLRGVRAGRALVVGDLDDDAALKQLARIAAKAVTRATGFWGNDWDRRVVVVAPRTLEEFADQLGEAPAIARGFAAVTTGHGAATGPLAPGRQGFVGSRVYVNPDSWEELGERYRLFVLAHETTHVAAEAVSRPSPPVWLSEGVADEVGFHGSGITEVALVAPLLERVRRSGPPAALPRAQDFSGDDPKVGARAYAGADVAVLLIEQTYGRAALRRFFHDVTTGVRGGLTPSRATSESMRADLGTTPEAFTKAWRAELRRLAAD